MKRGRRFRRSPIPTANGGPCDDPASFGTRVDVPAAVEAVLVNTRLGPAGLEVFATIPVGTAIETELVLQDGILFHLECGDGLRAEVDLHPFQSQQAALAASGDGTHLSLEASAEGEYEVAGTATVTPTRVQSSGCAGLVEGDAIEVPLTLRVTAAPSTISVATEDPDCAVWLSEQPYHVDVNDNLFRRVPHTWVGRGGVQVCYDGELSLLGSGSLDLVVAGNVERTIVVRSPSQVDEVVWSLFDAAGRSGMDDRLTLSAYPGGTVYVQELLADGLPVCKGDVIAQISSLTPDVCDLGSYPQPGFPIDNYGPPIEGQRIASNLVLIDGPGVCEVQIEVDAVLGGAGLVDERRFDVD